MLSLARSSSFKITSPDQKIECVISLKNGQVFYAIYHEKIMIVSPSALGFKIAGEKPLLKNLEIIRTEENEHEEIVEILWGEDHFLENNYHATTFELKEAKLPFRAFELEFRVFNSGVAFRYFLNSDKIKRCTIMEELTEFNLPLDSSAWKIDAYQKDRYEYNYEKVKVGDLHRAVHTPLTLKNQIYLSIHEAALYNYGAMNLKLNDKNILQAEITPLSDRSAAHVDLPFQTPWRVIMLAETAAKLTENRLIYVLNDPPKGDFGWVKTLKFIGIWWAMYVGEWTWAPGEKHGATTAHAKEYLDAALELGVKGVLIEGWNEGSWDGDWLENGQHAEFFKSTPDFDLPAVARYAAARDLELVGHHETVGYIDNYEKQLERAYNYYAANQIHYVKTGYSGAKMLIHGHEEFHHSQLGVNHYQKTVELAAKKKICLDIHEPIKGTGIERTWPNLLTREGARGQEYEGGSLDPSHACLLPFTRLLAGGMDYTNGVFDLENPAKPVRTTLARQLAYFVIFYSGMTMAADRPFVYEKYPDLFKIVKEVPTNFEKTVALNGEIGEYYVVARKDRDSNDWFLAGVTNEKSRDLKLPLDFLENGSFLAEIYADDFSAHYLSNPLKTQISQQHVKNADQLEIFMAPGGGFAIHLHKL